MHTPPSTNMKEELNVFFRHLSALSLVTFDQLENECKHMASFYSYESRFYTPPISLYLVIVSLITDNPHVSETVFYNLFLAGRYIHVLNLHCSELSPFIAIR